MVTETPRIDFVTQMTKIKDEGFIPTMRKGPTGIGFTLESKLGINENNYDQHDFIDKGEYGGLRFELKAQRVNVHDPRASKPDKVNNSMISLVTQAPHGGMKNRELIETYGYPATDGRDTINLYTTLVSTRYVNGKNVKNMKIKREGTRLNILHKEKTLSYYDLTKFGSKLQNLVIVRTDVEFRKCNCNNRNLHDKETGKFHEFFHFNNPYIYTGLILEKFNENLDNDKIKLDLRMHVPKNPKEVTEYHDPTHDHGTGFRTVFKNIKDLYKNERII